MMPSLLNVAEGIQAISHMFFSGSIKYAIRPPQKAVSGSLIIVPPFFLTSFIVTSTSSRLSTTMVKTKPLNPPGSFTSDLFRLLENLS